MIIKINYGRGGKKKFTTPDMERVFHWTCTIKALFAFRCVVVAVGEERYIRLRDAYPRYVSLLGVDQRRRSRSRAGRLRGDPCERDTLHRRVRREFIERRGHCREYYIIYITWFCTSRSCVGSTLRCRNLCPFVANRRWRSSLFREANVKADKFQDE